MKIEDKQMAVILFTQENFRKWKLPGWKITFSNHSGALGTCDQTKKKIRMSLSWMKVLSMTEIKQTVLHEIAHALTPPKYRSHGAEWRANARMVGVKDTYYLYQGGKVVRKKFRKSKY